MTSPLPGWTSGRDGRIVKVWKGYSEDRLQQIVADINQALADPR